MILRIMLKLDISKAYDRVSWPFLIEVLKKYGFKGRFLKMLIESISTPSYSMLVNGSPHGYFSCDKGLRQGDPCPLTFFIIIDEFLGRNILKYLDLNLLKEVKVASSLPLSSHQYFVYCTIIFSKPLSLKKSDGRTY